MLYWLFFRSISLLSPSSDVYLCQRASSDVRLPLCCLRSWKTYHVTKGPKFALEKKKAATDLTREMMQS